MEATSRASPPRRQPPGAFRFTRELYHQLAERGAFKGLRTELLEGEIVVMAPMSAEHAFAIQELQELLHEAKPVGLRVRGQLPLSPDDESSEPEPDFAIVPFAEPGAEHPATALLAIEVAFHSLKDDLSRKARIYANAGIPEYWVIDVKAREVVIHRSPAKGAYADVKRTNKLSNVKSSAVPELALDLRGIFPKK